MRTWIGLLIAASAWVGSCKARLCATDLRKEEVHAYAIDKCEWCTVLGLRQEIEHAEMERKQLEGLLMSTDVMESAQMERALAEVVGLEHQLGQANRYWREITGFSLKSAWNEALRASERVLTLLPASNRKVDVVKCAKGTLLDLLGDRERALNVFLELMAQFQRRFQYIYDHIQFQKDVHFHAGKLLLGMGNDVQAERVFRIVLTKYKQDLDGFDAAEAHAGLGRSLDLRLKKMKTDDDNRDSLTDQILKHYTYAIQLGCFDVQMMVRVGNLLAEREEWDAAARHLNNAITRWPDDPVLHVQLGRILWSRGYILRQYGGSLPDTTKADRLVGMAISHLQQATWRDKSNIQAKVYLAELLKLENRLEEALAIAEHAVELDRTHVDANLIAADIYMRLSKFNTAIDHLKHALMNEGELPLSSRLKVKLALANAFYGKGKYQDALNQYVQILDSELQCLDHDNSSSSLEEIDEHQLYELEDAKASLMVSIGLTRIKLGQKLEANQAFWEGLQTINGGDEGMAHIGYALTLPLDKKEEAAKHLTLGFFDESSTTTIRDVQFYVEAVERILSGEFLPGLDQSHATRILQMALAKWPKSFQVNFLLAKLVPSGDETIHYLQTAVASNSSCVKCHQLLGDLFMQRNKFYRALDYLTHAYKLDGEDPMTHLLMGNVLTKLGKLEMALESYLKAINLSLAQHLPSIQNQARIDAAAVYVQQGKVENAIHLLYDVVYNDPPNIAAHRSLAFVLAANGQPGSAHKHRMEAARLEKQLSQKKTFQETKSSDPPTSSWVQYISSTVQGIGHSLFRKDKATTTTTTTPPLFDENRTISTNGPRLCRRTSDHKKLLIEEAGSLFKLAGMFAVQGQVDEALECYEQIILDSASSNDNNEQLPLGSLRPAAQYELGLLLRSKNLDRAIDLLQDAIRTLSKDHPNHFNAILWAIKLLRERDDGTGDAGARLALASFAVSEYPTHAASFHVLGVELETSQSDKERAHQAFKETELILDSNHTMLAADTFFRLASYSDSRSISREYYEKVLEITNHEKKLDEGDEPLTFAFPSTRKLRLVSLLETASIYRELGNGQHAADLLVEASSLLVDEPLLAARCFYELGQTLLLDEQFVLGLYFLRGALSLAEDELATKIRPLIVTANLKLGQIEEAGFQTYQIALENSNPNAKDVMKLQKLGLYDMAMDLLQVLLQSENTPENRKLKVDIIAERAKTTQTAEFLSKDKELEFPITDGFAYALMDYSRMTKEMVQELEQSLEHFIPMHCIKIGDFYISHNDQYAAMRAYGRCLGKEYETIPSLGVDAHLMLMPAMVGNLPHVRQNKSILSHDISKLYQRLAQNAPNHEVRAVYLLWIALNEGSASDWLAYARTLEKTNYVDHAVRLYVGARESGLLDEPTATCGLKRSLLKSGKLEDILSIRNSQGDCPCAMIVDAHALHALGRDRESKQAFSTAMNVLSSPYTVSSKSCEIKDFEPVLQYGLRLKSEGDFNKAAATFAVIVNDEHLRFGDQYTLKKAWVEYGSTLFHVGDYTHAVQILLRVVEELNPSSINAHNNLGVSLYKLGELRGAINHLLQVLRLCDEQFDGDELCKVAARANLALAYEGLGEYELAENHLRAVLSNSAEKDSGVDRIALQRQLARLLKARSKLEPAIIILRDTLKSLQLELMQINTSTKIAAIESKSSLTMRQKQLKARMIAVNLDMIAVSRDLGLLFSQTNQHEASIRMLRSVLLMQSVENIGEDGGTSVWDLVDALPLPKIEKYLKNPQPLIDLGNAYFRYNELEQAKRMYKLCERLFPKESTALNNLGVVAYYEGHMELATAYFKKAIKADPNSQQAVEAFEYMTTTEQPGQWMMQVLPYEKADILIIHDDGRTRT